MIVTRGYGISSMPTAKCVLETQLVTKLQLIGNMMLVSSQSAALQIVGSIRAALVTKLPLSSVLAEKIQLSGEILVKNYLQAELKNVLELGSC